MRIEQAVLASKIAKLKTVVPKVAVMAELQGILIQDGWMTATNLQLTVKTRLDGVDPGEKMFLPVVTFDLIANLPPGELEITGTDEVITIRMEAIENEFPTMPADRFPASKPAEGECSASMKAETFREKLANVIWAVPKKGGQPLMESLYIDCRDGNANFVGLDGKTVAWDSFPYPENVSLLIPRDCVEQLLKLDLQGDLRIKSGKMHSSFETDDYIVETRLREGQYYDYRKMFEHKSQKHLIVIDRKQMLEAIRRASLCADVDKPVILNFDGPTVTISVASAKSKYRECLLLDNEMQGALEIAFSPKVLEGNIRAFPSDKVTLMLDSALAPMVCNAEGVALTTFTLPVRYK